MRLYSWAKKYVEVGTKSISLEELRKVMGLQPLTDADEGDPGRSFTYMGELPAACFGFGHQGITKKTDLRIKIAEIERGAHRQVLALTITIKTQAS